MNDFDYREKAELRSAEDTDCVLNTEKYDVDNGTSSSSLETQVQYYRDRELDLNRAKRKNDTCVKEEDGVCHVMLC